MTADAAHVAAVAEALAGSWRIAADSTSRAIAREVAYAEATVAVETLTPLIEADLRKRLSAEVRVDCVRDRHTLGTHTCVTCERIAARIVRGQS